jgi:hypothetical protein
MRMKRRYLCCLLRLVELLLVTKQAGDVDKAGFPVELQDSKVALLHCCLAEAHSLFDLIYNAVVVATLSIDR